MTTGPGREPEDAGGFGYGGAFGAEPPQPGGRTPAGEQAAGAAEEGPADEGAAEGGAAEQGARPGPDSAGANPGARPVAAEEQHPAGAEWCGVERALLTLRRLVLLVSLLPLAAATGLLLGFTAGPGWSAFALLPLVGAFGGWWALGRNWRSWRYVERADDLLTSRGVLWRQLTLVPYGRMQLVEVTSGPLERKFGLARLQLHTAAATTDATVPGLAPDEAERLRDRLTSLGEARSAGL